MEIVVITTIESGDSFYICHDLLLFNLKTMKKNKFILLFAILAIFTLYQTACTSDKLPEPMVGEECDDHDATYDGDVKAIIDATCAIAGCHVMGAGVPGNFETFESLVDFANDAPNGFRDRVIVLRDDPNTGMPPDWDTNPGPIDLTEEQFEIFKCWADAGYPEN